MQNSFIRVFSIVLFSFAITAVSQAHAEGPNSATVGLILDLTGPAAPLGEDCRQGFEVARRSFDVPGASDRSPVHFLIGDSRGDPKTAVTEFSRMVNLEHALAVIVSRTHLAAAVNPISRQMKVPLLASSANPKFVDENEYAFRIWVRADREGDALARKALELGAKKLALVTTEDDYLISMSNSFVSSFGSRGGKIVYDEKVDKDFMDFSTLLSRVKTKNPDAVFVNVGIPQLGVAYRRMHDLGLRKQNFSSYWIFKKDVLEAAGEQAVEGAIAVEMDYRKPKFESAFRAQFGHPPLTSMAYSCYLGTAQLLQAIKRKPSMQTTAEMYSALRENESVQLLDDAAVFKDRELQSPLRYEVYRNGVVDTGEQ